MAIRSGRAMKDGTPLLVDPTGGNGAKTTPLTIAMINDPTNSYAAAPNVDSGTIANPLLRSALTAVDPVRGTAATGVAGVPISQIQYNYTRLFPDDVVTREGWLKNFSVLTDVQTYWKNRACYTELSALRQRDAHGGEASAPALPAAERHGAQPRLQLSAQNAGRLQRYSWSTQLNVRNAFNHYKVLVLPTAGNGNTLNARLSTQPRTVIWTNTFSF